MPDSFSSFAVIVYIYSSFALGLKVVLFFFSLFAKLDAFSFEQVLLFLHFFLSSFLNYLCTLSSVSHLAFPKCLPLFLSTITVFNRSGIGARYGKQAEELGLEGDATVSLVINVD